MREVAREEVAWRLGPRKSLLSRGHGVQEAGSIVTTSILRVPDIGQRSTSLVNDSFTGTFHFNYGIADRAVVGISAPTQLMSGDPQPGVAGWGPQLGSRTRLPAEAIFGDSLSCNALRRACHSMSR